MPRYDDELDDEFDDDTEENEDDDDRGEQQERFVRMSRKDIKRLERKAKQVDKANERVAALERERAFEKAKVDVSTPLGKHFAKHYDGEVDPVKIREQAEELGVPLVEGDKPKAEGPDLQPGEEDSTRERQEVASGGKPDEGEEPPPPDPKAEAIKAGQAVIDGGKTEEDGLAAGIGALAAAAQAGDERAVWDPTKS